MNGENVWRAEKEHFFLRNRGSERSKRSCDCLHCWSEGVGTGERLCEKAMDEVFR